MKLNKYTWISLGILAGISALAYLPLIHKLGYMNDDWYLMYDVRVRGAEFFHEIFSSDRPGRAYLMIPMYSLFGLNPLPYNLTAYFFRFLGGVSLFWVLQILWPQRKSFSFVATLFFTIYPGFLSQTNAIDYQSHVLALFFAISSVALTLQAIRSTGQVTKIGLIILSVLTGWMALSQMEYYIGIEAFRLACIAVFVWRSQAMGLFQKMRATLYKWLPFTVIPAVFLFWRIFLFQTERKATDIGSQLGQLFTSPLTGLWWFTYLVQDFFNVLLAPWVLPFSMYVFPMRLQNQMVGLGLAIMAVALFVWGNHLVAKNESEELSVLDHNETREQISVGMIGIVGGLAPVIAANRHVILPDYSRYTLIASVGAVILLTVFIHQFSSQKLKVVVAGLMIAISVFTHYGNSVKAVTETEIVHNFWWQVAWRVPQIKSGTTISVSYPNVAIQEDYFIWGPVNHIYSSDMVAGDVFQIRLPSIVLNEYTVSRIITGRGEDTFYKRGDVLIVNEYDNILIMAQATQDSCVRVVDGESPDLSMYDDQRIMLVAPYSKLNDVVTNGASPTPPSLIFGNEPPHNWCYFYQKADLARQQGDWLKIVSLYADAVKSGYHPNDQIELMPFLQAYTYLGDRKMVKDLSTRINTSVFYAEQACYSLANMTDRGYPLSSKMQAYVDELFCK